MACGNDCWLREWLREDGPNSLGGDITIDSGEAHHTDSQPVMQPHEAAHLLYKPIYLWQTRLIRLEPGSSGNPLRCELLTADMTSTSEFGEGLGVHKYGAMVEYTALSYCWGDKRVFTSPLHCGDVCVGITENLASAFYNLRLPNEPYFLWIDFLSINQCDNAEKGQHVQHMLGIYKAKSVIVWLGPHSSSTYQAFRFLRKTFDWERCQRELMDSTHSPDCLRKLQVSYHALQELFRRPWFRRTWIRQEVFGARMVNVRCGSFVEPMGKFTGLLDSIIKARGLQTPSDDVVQFRVFDELDAKVVKLSFSPDYMSSEQYWPSLKTQCGMWWLRVLLDGALYEVTDPRDRVYAHIGIVRDSSHGKSCACNNNKLPIDYNKSLSVVYQDLVKHLINQEGKLASLQIFESRLDRNPDLPSWVTDFGRRMPRALIDRGARFETTAKRQDLSQLDKLTLTGRWVGTVGFIWEPDPVSLRAGWNLYKRDYPTVHNRTQHLIQDFVHFGLDEEFNAFVDSGQYRQASVGPQWALSPGVFPVERTYTYYNYRNAFVAEGVQRGDLIMHPEGGDISFVVRKYTDQGTGSTVYTFLGPAVYGYWRAEWTELPVEDFVMI